MSNYKGYTPAQSKAHNNYIAKFARLEVQEAIERDNATRESARGRTDAKEEVGE